MKKSTHIALAILVGSGTSMYASEGQAEGKIQRAWQDTKESARKAGQWIKEKATQYTPEDITIAKRIRTGTTAAGLISGYVAGKWAAQKTLNWLYGLETVTEAVPTTTKALKRTVKVTRRVAPHVVGLGVSWALQDLWDRLGTRGALFYLMKKHNLPRHIAFAFLIANISPNDGIKALFNAAEKKNTTFLRNFFAAFYENMFGKNWYPLVMSLMGQMIEAPFKKLSEELDNKNKLYNTVGLPYATALLYWGRPIQEKGITFQLQVTKQLLDSLFGKIKAETPEPATKE